MLFNMIANFCSKFFCKCFDVFGGRHMILIRKEFPLSTIISSQTASISSYSRSFQWRWVIPSFISTALPPPALILSFLSNVYPLICRNEFSVLDDNRVSLIPKILIFFWFIKCSKTSLLFQSPHKFFWYIEKPLSACPGPGLTSISPQARSENKNKALLCILFSVQW